MSASSDDATRAAACALATDVVVRAGAGTGKTFTLVEVFVSLIAGETALGRRVPVGRILCLTFSEKAAGELRARVRSKLEELADAPPERGEPRLTAAEWRAAATAVGPAPISTFHAFAAGLLRRHAAAAGIDPAFALLAEDESSSLRRGETEKVVLASLEAGDAVTRSLVTDVGFEAAPGSGAGARGLVDHLLELGARLEEEGRAPATLLADVDSLEDAQARRAQAAATLLEALDDLVVALDTTGRSGGRKVAPRIAALGPRLMAARGPAMQALAGLALDADPVGEPALASLREAVAGSLGTDARNAAARRVREAFEGLREAWASALAAGRAAQLLTLVERSIAAYRAAKTERGALDFADLIGRSHELMVRDAAARADAQSRYDAILVDEFQDTNELQDELVRLVQGEGRRLVVGDPKQSIYEFRGADVAVFGRVAADVARRGGEVLPLRTCRRGRAPIVDFVNRLFARALRPGGEKAHDFEIVFDADADALAPLRPAPDGGGPLVELLDDEHEAIAVARHLRAGVDAGELRYGDAAILLRRFTRLDRFLGELRRASIPHYVVNGRGFYEAQEVRDLSHALTLLEDPEDGLALLGVLRSPLVGLSDTALIALADVGAPSSSGRPARLALGRLLGKTFVVPASLAPDEAERLRAFLDLYRRLARHADRLGPAGVLRAIVDETDLPAILATTYHGEQRVANLERLLELAAEHDAAGVGFLDGARGFVRRLRAEAQRERSLAAPAQLLGEHEDVVRVMTVHQSKGLEFPVVYVPECGAPERDPNGPIVYDRAAGLGMKPRGVDGTRVLSTRARGVNDLRRARARAESLRLFYVATTRARDRLILSGTAPRNQRGGGAECWRRHVDGLLAEDSEAAKLVRIVAPPAIPTSTPTPIPIPTPTPIPIPTPTGKAVATPTPPAKTPTLRAVPELAAMTRPDLDELAWAARVVAPPATGAATLLAPVTELADFDHCPRRYRLRHEIGVEEHPRPPDVDDDGRDIVALAELVAQTDAPAGLFPVTPLDARAKGTLAHRLLERIDLPAFAHAGESALDALLAAEGHDPRSLTPDLVEVRTTVLGLLRSPFGAGLVARPAAAVERELPFAFVPRPALGAARGPKLLLNGKMDLVLFDDDEITVLDYKLARPGRGEAYRFQLAAYAAAARALRPTAKRVRAGLIFLLERTPTPQLVELSAEELDATEARLAQLATELAEARRRDTWSGRAVETCHRLRCGYVRRCHGAAAADSAPTPPPTSTSAR